MNMRQKTSKGIAILLLVMIVGAIFVSILVTVEIMIRQAHIFQSFNFSERARLAALVGKDASAFEVYENYCRVDTNECNIQKTLSDGSQYSTLVTINTKEPETRQINGIGQDITFSNPWEIKLKANKSFTFYLDLNSSGTIYPKSLTVSQATASPSQLSFSKCKAADPPGICSEETITTTTSIFPVTLDLSGSLSYYYRLTITNGDTDNVIYILTPSIDAPIRPLPVGVNIVSTGTFKDYEEKTSSNLFKWGGRPEKE